MVPLRSWQFVPVRLTSAVPRCRAISMAQKAFFVLLLSMAAGVFASDAELIGLTAMRRERPAVTGAGIPVGHPEAQVDTNAWEVNPSINSSISFTWTSFSGTSSSFPNPVGLESWHANTVGAQLYGTGTGV